VRVNLDTAAHDDPRFARLGLLLGAPAEFAHDVGLARMTKVWAYCTKRETTHLEDWEVAGFIGRGDAMALLVEARLATLSAERGYYIAGTKGRIEWYSTALRNGRKGGRPRNQPVTEDENQVVIHPVTHPGNHPQEKEKEDLRSSLLSLALTRDPSAPSTSTRSAWALAVYRAYPRKEGKAKGLAKLTAQLKSPDDAANALKAAENYAAHVKAEGRELAYVKHFSSWVSEWPDWITPEAVPARASPNGRPTAPLKPLPDLSSYETEDP
jgi:hypothetical protein